MQARVNRHVMRGAYQIMKVVFALLPVLMPACGLPDAQAGVRQDGSRPANFTKIDKDLYFGGEPGSNEAFAFLARLGIRTVVSVDGARPRVAEAEKCGLRYVHIPLGYDGVTSSAGMQLAALARNSQGPWYVHCHHGRHRGPAAAAVICLATEKMDVKGALDLMRRAGTSKKYVGLWRDVAAYVRPPEHADLPKLVPVSEVDALITCMVQLDRAFSHLKAMQRRQWQPLPDHPDITASREVLLLQEGYHEAVRSLMNAAPKQAELLDWMKESETAAIRLRKSLEGRQSDLADKQLEFLSIRCQRCHELHRQ